jgi:hypothetical protein
MATTYTLISSVTVGSGGAANIEFTSIPSTYTDLVVVLSGRSNTTFGADGFAAILELNGSTSDRSNRYLRNYNGTVGSFSTWNGSSNTIFSSLNPSDYTANTFNNTQWYLPNYAGSNNKSVSIDSVTENNSTDIIQTLTAGLWSNSAAITSIKLNPSPASFVQYSTAYLYGISNA